MRFNPLDYRAVLIKAGVRFTRDSDGRPFMYWRTRPGQLTEATRVVFLWSVGL